MDFICYILQNFKKFKFKICSSRLCSDSNDLYFIYLFNVRNTHTQMNVSVENNIQKSSKIVEKHI